MKITDTTGWFARRLIVLSALFFAIVTAAQAATLTASPKLGSSGQESKGFAPLIGIWSLADDGGRTCVKVDGSSWKQGKAAPELQTSARTLYGNDAKAFAKTIEAHADFPSSVFTGLDTFREGEISLRFKALKGKEDQAAGILFGFQPNGDCLILRANALEDNLILFTYTGGKRREVAGAEKIPTPSGVWHDLKLVVKGKTMEGYLDGKPCLKHELPTQPDGRIGIWSKADSVVLFDSFTVTIPD